MGKTHKVYYKDTLVAIVKGADDEDDAIHEVRNDLVEWSSREV